jgi:hypothetical protein
MSSEINELEEEEKGKKRFKWIWKLGMALVILGALCKIEHLVYAEYLLVIGLITLSSTFIIEFTLTKEKGREEYLQLSKILYYLMPLIAMLNRELLNYLAPIYMFFLLLRFGNYISKYFSRKRINES